MQILTGEVRAKDQISFYKESGRAGPLGECDIRGYSGEEGRKVRQQVVGVKVGREGKTWLIGDFWEKQRSLMMFSDAFCLIHVVKLLFHFFTYSKYLHYSSRSRHWTGVSLSVTLYSVLSGEEGLHITNIVR